MFEIFKGDLRVRIASQGSDGIYVSFQPCRKKERVFPVSENHCRGSSTFKVHSVSCIE